MAKPTYRFTAVTNLAIQRQDPTEARDYSVEINEDIPASQEVVLFDTTGSTGGTATLVQRTNGVNSAPVTVRRTYPRSVSISALYAGLVDTTKFANPYKDISF